MNKVTKIVLGAIGAALVYGFVMDTSHRDEIDMQRLAAQSEDYVSCVKTEGLNDLDWMTCRYKEDLDYGPVWIMAGDQDGRKRYVAANGPALSIVDTYQAMGTETQKKYPVVVKRDPSIDAKAPGIVPWDKLN